MTDLLPLLLQVLQLYQPSVASRLIVVPLDTLLSELFSGILPEPELRKILQPFQILEDSSGLVLLRELIAFLDQLPEMLTLPAERMANLSDACDTLLAIASAGHGAINHLALPLNNLGVLRLVQELRIEPPEQEEAAPIILVGGPFAQEVVIGLRGERMIERQTEIIYGDRSPFPQIQTSHLEIRRSRSRQNLRKPVIQLPGAGYTFELYSHKERLLGSIQTTEEAPYTLVGRAITLSFSADAQVSFLVTSVRDDRALLLSQVVRVVKRGK